MPHDKTRKTGLALCGRRTSQCGILRKSDATSRPQRQNGTSTGNVMLDTSPGRRRLSSQSRSLSASDAAAVTNNPHSIENLPALSSLSDLSPLQLTLTAATNLRRSEHSLPLRECPLAGGFCSHIANLKNLKAIGTVWTMGSILKLFVPVFSCVVTFLLWIVQPDRALLDDLEQELEATPFSEVETLMGRRGFRSQTLTYYALARQFSRGDGTRPMVFMSSDVQQAFLTLCPIECQVTTSERREEVPFLGMDRNYKFHSVSTDTGKTEVLPDHAFWIMYLP